MSLRRVASYSAVLINRYPSESSKSITDEACQSSAPSTEGYRNQQFMDITDSLEEPPPYQADVAEYFTIVQDSSQPLTSDSINTFHLSGRLSYLQADQYTRTGDFILFQGEAMETDSRGDVEFSDASSSQVSCCSDVRVCSSTESSAASSTSVHAKHETLASIDARPPDTDEPCDTISSVNSSRLLRWLQSVSSPSPESNVPSVSISSQPDIIAPIHYAETCADSCDKSLRHHHRHNLGTEESVDKF